MAKKACTLTPSSRHLNICSLNSTIAFNSPKVQCVAAKWDSESLIRDYCLSCKISTWIFKGSVSEIEIQWFFPTESAIPTASAIREVRVMSMVKQFSVHEFLPKMLLKGSPCVRMSKSGLVLAPMVTLKVLVNIRLGQNVPFSSITNLNFLNFSQKCHPGASRWSGWPGWG